MKQVDIKMILVEVEHVGDVFKSTLEDVEEIMTKNGYETWKHVNKKRIPSKNSLKFVAATKW